MKKYSIFVIAVLLAAGFATCSLAAKKRPDLTPEQIAQYKAKRDADRAAMSAQNAQLKALTDQLRAEMQKKPVDKDKVADLMKQIDIQRETARIQQMETMIKNRPNLSPDEKKRYDEMIQQSKDRLDRRQKAK